MSEIARDFLLRPGDCPTCRGEEYKNSLGRTEICPTCGGGREFLPSLASSSIVSSENYDDPRVH
ncbi:MAG: hypothetical protein V1696_01180 [Candidatus Jorgensenbacteria bacterium]